MRAQEKKADDSRRKADEANEAAAQQATKVAVLGARASAIRMKLEMMVRPQQQARPPLAFALHPAPSMPKRHCH